MANIRQRMDSVERMLGEVLRGAVPCSETEKVLDATDSELHVIGSVLEEGGDSNAPICCFQVEDGKIGCGRYVDPEHEEFVMDIVAPLDEFVKHCKKCRGTIQDKLPRARGKVRRARALHNLPLEEILGDLEGLHFAQKAIEHLHTPITCDEELERHTRKILPYAQSLPYHDGQFRDELRKIYFALGERDTSTYQGSGWVRISQDSIGQSHVYSAVSHELNHLLVGVLGASEAVVMILGMETDALLVLGGDKNHEVALYRVLKNLAAYTAYIKARWVSRVGRWQESMGRLFPADLVASIEERYQKSFTAEFEKGYFSFGDPDSYYTLVPYLALKEALREDRDYILQSDIFERDIEVPALVRILKRVLA